ncbi:MAG: 50S ribosomal protein L1 [Candidatus Methanofastidiosa archaeon]|nr:50S ribosomal protein L1 [Candidatus Methanofastidiosa archaeon]
MIEAITRGVKEAREKSKPRNFTQSFELIANLKEIDIKKPEFKIRQEVALPNGRGKSVKIAVIADREMALNAKELGLDVIEDLETFSGNKREAKKFANNHDFFIAQADLMPTIGKMLGPVLAPRGKMPKPMPPTAPLEGVIKNLDKTVKIDMKKAPVIQALIGSEKMTDKQIAENAMAVLGVIERKYERGLAHIKSIYVKTTMGEPVKVEV